jgi:ATP/maltotriose-dependent transcriptional regulator MalT
VSEAGDLYQEGLEAFRRGDNDRSRELNERSLTLAREQDDAPAIVDALIGLARVALRDEDLERVHVLATEARELGRKRGLTGRPLALPLHLDAEATRMSGDFAGARALYEESIALNLKLGDERGVALEQANLAWVAINESRIDEAERLVRACLDSGHAEEPYLHAFCSIGLARCAAERGDRARARELLAEADEELATAGLVLDPTDRPEYDKTVALTRE